VRLRRNIKVEPTEGVFRDGVRETPFFPIRSMFSLAVAVPGLSATLTLELLQAC